MIADDDPGFKRLVKRIAYRYGPHICRPVYSGVGSILMFHRFVDDPPPVRVGFGRAIEHSTGMVEALIRRLRTSGYTFVSLNEMLEALSRKRRAGGKMIVFTIDDGYRDVYTHAFLLLRSLNVPLTLYVASGFPDKTVAPWFYLLEERLLEGGRW
jgi:peptidoglycan/xylan/chitin deacetylase (PgdA/CDA1 family)